MRIVWGLEWAQTNWAIYWTCVIIVVITCHVVRRTTADGIAVVSLAVVRVAQIQINNVVQSWHTMINIVGVDVLVMNVRMS